MSTPYWGDLPDPKVSEHPKNNRSSSNGPMSSSRAPRRQSLDAQSGPSQPRSNRTSLQTTNTEAPTDSTLSPYASPTTSSVHGQGLAPRPPTLPYGQNQYPPDVLEKRRRRASRNREEEYAQAGGSATLPAAPDVPKAPPSSFRHPYGNGGLPYTIAKPGATQQPDYPMSPANVNPEEYYTTSSATQAGHDNLPAMDRSQQQADPTSSSRRRINGSEAAQLVAQMKNGGTRDASGHRKTSLGPESDRRTFAVLQSPLQKLELTLDSITKEEKRARLLEVERRARERAPQGTGKDTSQQPSVRFNDRKTSASAEVRRGQVLQDHKPAQPGAATSPLTQNPPEEGKQYSSHAGKSPKVQIPSQNGTHVSSMPHRNLSFRERAARNDVKVPKEPGNDSPRTPPATTPTGGISLTRSGSNKLKKEPPGDPWYQRRTEAEKKFSVVQPRGASTSSIDELGKAAAPAGPTNTRSTQGSVRSKVPPPSYPSETWYPSDRNGPVDDPESPTIPLGKPLKTHSQRQGSTGDQVHPRPLPVGTDPRINAIAQRTPQDHATIARATGATGTTATFSGRQYDGNYSDEEDSHADDEHYYSQYFHHREKLKPGQGMYNPPKYLNEWKKGTIGTLSGAFLDLSKESTPKTDKGQTWWESPPSKRRGSISSRPRKAEAFDGEYDETNAPTRFKPPLYLKCGPLLRYCGIRNERVPTRSIRTGVIAEREIWRGTIMIVTQDQDSSYDIAPTLRLFVQPIELLPPPPSEVHGEVPAEYVDPIACHPKLGRKGETLYVRPVDYLDESKDLSRDETDNGLFEKTRSPPDGANADASAEAPGSFNTRKKRTPIDGEKVGKYKDVRGYRLHAERGCTFWRFSIEVELGEKEQRIAYRINRGPATGFWVPARGQSMNIMFHSCNGFSLSVNPDQLSGPDPMWRDVLNSHQSRPFHVMLGGGDQLYCDAVMKQTQLFQNWLMIRNPLHKHNAPFTPDMQDELEEYYLERYCMWFSQGLFGLANSQIPMVNMYDDHDIIDGFGSYPHHFMNAPVFSGLGNVAFKYYMLFQQQSISDESEATEPSWALGTKPGPYISELSRSLFMHLGSKIALLAVDCRTERTRDEVVRDDTWKKLMDRCYDEIVKGKTEHLLVLLGVPIAYPRLVWLENILTSRLMDPVKALGKTGLFRNVFNKFDGGVEVLDDLDDHWTAKNHKDERSIVIEDLQDLAADKSVRVTILSGDVHLAAVGQFYSNPKLDIAKHKDFRYMPNVISSAIVNTPPPDLMADVLNKRNKVHHFDKDTDEDMIPMFAHGVEGKPRNNKRLLPHRNWCSIREYTPGDSPPSSPPPSAYEQSPVSTPGNKGIMRRLSKRDRGPSYRADVINSRPPVSGGGANIFRTFSRRRSTSETRDKGKGKDSAAEIYGSMDKNNNYKPPGGMLTRTLSLTRGDFSGMFRRKDSSKGRKNRSNPNDGGINGTWGDSNEDEYEAETEDETETMPLPSRSRRGRGFGAMIGLRGGGGSSEEFSKGDDSYFTSKAPYNTGATSGKAAHLLGNEEGGPSRGGGGGAYKSGGAGPGRGNGSTAHRPIQQQAQSQAGRFDSDEPIESFRPKAFHRTPTSMSAKQRKRAETFEVNIEGGLDICLNVEVSAQDPAGITMPYRLLVPKLWYEANEEDEVELPEREERGGIKRLLSLNRGKSVKTTTNAAPAAPGPPIPPPQRERPSFAFGGGGGGGYRERRLSFDGI